VGLGWLLFTRPDSPEAGFMKQLCSPLWILFGLLAHITIKVYREATSPVKRRMRAMMDADKAFGWLFWRFCDCGFKIQV